MLAKELQDLNLGVDSTQTGPFLKVTGTKPSIKSLLDGLVSLLSPKGDVYMLPVSYLAQPMGIYAGFSANFT